MVKCECQEFFLEEAALKEIFQILVGLVAQKLKWHLVGFVKCENLSLDKRSFSMYNSYRKATGNICIVKVYLIFRQGRCSGWKYVDIVLMC